MIVASVLIYSQYRFEKSRAVELTVETFSDIYSSLRDTIDRENEFVFNLMQVARNGESLQKWNAGDSDNLESAKELIDILSRRREAYSAYIADDSGNFLEVINLEATKGLREIFSSPTDSRWMVVSIWNRMKSIVYYDENLSRLSQESMKSRYDPRRRPWYVKAMKSDDVVVTGPYLFFSINRSGLTYAVKTKDRSKILGVDFTLDQMNSYLSSLKPNGESEVFIADRHGKKIFSSSFVEDNVTEEMTMFNSDADSNLAEIKDRKAFSVMARKDFYPYSYIEAGVMRGRCIELMKRLSVTGGFGFYFEEGDSASSDSGDIDIVPCMVEGDYGSGYRPVGEPLSEVAFHYITLPGATKREIAVLVRGRGIDDRFKKRKGEIEYIEVASLYEAYNLLAEGRADFLLDTPVSAEYMSKFFSDSTFVTMDKFVDLNLYIGVSSAKRDLYSTIENGLSKIDRGEMESMVGGKIGSPAGGANDMVDTPLVKAMERGDTGKVIEYSKDGKRLYGVVEKMKNDDMVLGVVLDRDFLLEPYLRYLRESSMLAFFVMLLSMPMVLLSVKFIVRPIFKIVEENKKIKRHDFEHVEKKKTHIVELDELSDSMVEMSESIVKFEKSEEKMVDSLVRLIASAVDAQSRHMGQHCRRMPMVAMDILEALDRAEDGKYADFEIGSEYEKREFEISAWLHDCGKIAIPNHVMNKSVKLEMPYNRIHEIRTRFEVVYRDIEISRLRGEIDDSDAERRKRRLIEDFEFVARLNIGDMCIDEEDIARLLKIADIRWIRHFDDRLGLGDEEKARYAKDPVSDTPVEEKLISDKPHHIVERRDDYGIDYDNFSMPVPGNEYDYGEIYNLSIHGGTLSEEERFKIKEHVVYTIKMLEDIPFPSRYANIPKYAGMHHETIDGRGYPRGLKGDEIPVASRVLAIADIFEALTAGDRPYKRARTLSETLEIMDGLAKRQAIDPDIYRVFVEERVFATYARENLTKEQIDIEL
jgi:HD-GYP domain-containing protein (c-di-GMP phosphodiesterase class II)